MRSLIDGKRPASIRPLPLDIRDTVGVSLRQEEHVLIIRKPQEEAFRLLAEKRFQDELVAMVARRFRVDFELLGEQGVRSVVQLGMERAHRYDLTARGDLAGFVCMMFVLGSRFDEDPQLPWAAEALQVSPGSLGTLFGDAVDFMRRASGPKGEIYTRMLLEVRRTSWSDLRAQPPESWVQRLYPAKVDEIGPRAFDDVRRVGAGLAKRWGLDAGHGAALCAGLALALGTGFASDPLYPWIEPAVKVAQDAPVGEERTRMLYVAVQAQIERGLAARRLQGS